jgi:hypothetical protein
MLPSSFPNLHISSPELKPVEPCRRALLRKRGTSPTWGYSITNPRRIARESASVRLEAPSFAKIDAI